MTTINGRDFYLGKHGTAESRRAYARLLAEYHASHGVLPETTADFTVVELLSAFKKYAHSVHTTKECEHFGYAYTPLKALYARTPVAEFGPLKLKAVRQRMIDTGLARPTINKRISRIRHIFKWGVENELVPAPVLQALQAVAGLRFGRTEARETEPVKPVPDAFVDEVIDHVSPVVGAMIELQRITGMRSGEVTIIRGCDIDTSGKVWIYTPATHKTAYRGHHKRVYLGPKAQRVLKPFLRSETNAYLFSPQESCLQLFAKRHARRKTPIGYGNRPGTNRVAKPKRKPGEVYSVANYRQAISRGIEKANKARLKAAAAKGIPADKVALDGHALDIPLGQLLGDQLVGVLAGTVGTGQFFCLRFAIGAQPAKPHGHGFACTINFPELGGITADEFKSSHGFSPYNYVVVKIEHDGTRH